jgi:hypothetical protein
LTVRGKWLPALRILTGVGRGRQRLPPPNWFVATTEKWFASVVPEKKQGIQHPARLVFNSTEKTLGKFRGCLGNSSNLPFEVPSPSPPIP